MNAPSDDITLSKGLLGTVAGGLGILPTRAAFEAQLDEVARLDAVTRARVTLHIRYREWLGVETGLSFRDWLSSADSEVVT